jgi:hypothetical protein
MEVKGSESVTQRVQTMGWNPRRGKSYFYTSYRDTNGRVRTKYIGAGANAQAIASRINKSRHERKQQYTDRLRARQLFDELNELIEPIEQEATSLIRAAMSLAGFRAYPGGRWRRRRKMQEARQQTPEFNTLDDAIEAAESGDPRGLNVVRNYLIANPDHWKSSGDVAILAVRQWIQKASGGDLMMREMLGKKQADLRNSLKTTDDGPIERLFIDRVVLTWFRVNYFERLCALPEPANVTWARMHAEQLQRAETSHRRALRDFLTYRDHKPDITIEIREAESQKPECVPQSATTSFEPANRIHDLLPLPV